jgi:hypothetical protein
MARQTQQELVEEQNLLAGQSRQEDAPARGQRVRVVVAGRYNGPDNKAQTAQVDDVIVVAGGWYAAELLAAGLVTTPEPMPAAASTPAPRRTRKAK